MYQADEKRYDTMKYNRCGNRDCCFQSCHLDCGTILERIVIIKI